MATKTQKTIKLALKLSMPIFVGYFFLGMAYGVLMQQQGLHIVWTFLMSAFVFAGTLQYAAIPLLAGAFSPLPTLLLSLGINARHLFYGIAIFDRYKPAKKSKGFLLFTLADEAFSINASTPLSDDYDPIVFYNTVSVASYVYWITFTLLGHASAEKFQITIKGLEFVLPALFFTLFLTMWKEKEKRSSLMLGVIITIVCATLFSDSMFIIVSLLGITAVMLLYSTKESHHE